MCRVTASMKTVTKFTITMLVPLFLLGLAFAAIYVTTPHGSAVTQKLSNRLGISGKHMCFYLPNDSTAFEEIDLEQLQAWNKSVRYAINPNNLSVASAAEGSALRQRFNPSEDGSERVVINDALEERGTYELRQRIFFEEGFEWGGDAKSGKFGFSLGGGSAPTGGSTDKDGSTARLAWIGHEDATTSAALYLYSADRSLNLPYGDLIEIPNFIIPVGEWFDMTIRLTVNSEHSLADGSISVHVNDKLLLERENIQWQSAGDKPVINRLIFSSFHGGNSTAWSPSKIVYARFANACLYD